MQKLLMMQKIKKSLRNIGRVLIKWQFYIPWNVMLIDDKLNSIKYFAAVWKPLSNSLASAITHETTSSFTQEIAYNPQQ